MSLHALEQLPEHPTSQVYAALARDSRSDKIDLGIGVYRDARGHAPIMACVVEAQRRVIEKQTTREYLTPLGNLQYCRQVEALILGSEHPALLDRRVRSAQTPGAGGALRVAAELIKSMPSQPTLWVPKPTWEQQLSIFESAGLRLAEYPYYDSTTQRLSFEDMLATLGGASSGDCVLLHGCCHNPTGEDLTADHWQILADRLPKLGLLPFVDLAYQGFGDGIEEDVLGIRLLARAVPEMMVVSSSSKSFGVYRDRAGAITLLLATPETEVSNTRKHLLRVAASLYFMPPDHGAAMVAEILADPNLRSGWFAELDAMRQRIQDLRHRLSDALTSQSGAMDFEFLKRQKGMFSLLPLQEQSVHELARRHGIYMMPNARINLAALSAEHVPRVAAAIAGMLKRG